MNLVEEALAQGRKTLSEHASKQFLSSHGIPVCREVLARSEDEAVRAASDMGFPVVMKACGADLTHKTEDNLIRLGIRSEEEVREVYGDLSGKPIQGIEGVLVQEMVLGHRELVIGLIRDPQFGPCVMFGFGGIFTEVLNDVTFRVAPLEPYDAMEMMEEIRSKKVLDPFRGEPAVDKEKLAQALIALGKIGMENPAIQEVDINPLKIREGTPVAVDALVVLAPPEETP
jgi:acetyl-CoA synthetase (ADP-forming)